MTLPKIHYTGGQHRVHSDQRDPSAHHQLKEAFEEVGDRVALGDTNIRIKTDDIVVTVAGRQEPKPPVEQPDDPAPIPTAPKTGMNLNLTGFYKGDHAIRLPNGSINPKLVERLRPFKACIRLMDHLAVNKTGISTVEKFREDVKFDDLMALCVAVEAEVVYINVPHRANDELQRHIFGEAKRLLPASTRIAAAWSNEAWNGAFKGGSGLDAWGQFTWVEEHAKARGVPGAQIYAEQCLRTWRIADDVLGRDRVIAVLESMNATPNHTRSRLTLPEVRERVDVIAVGPYAGVDYRAKFFADDAKKVLRPGVTKDTILDAIAGETETDCYRKPKEHREIARELCGRDVALWAYEANHHITGSGTTDEFRELARQAIRDPRMFEITRQIRRRFFDAGGSMWVGYALSGWSNDHYFGVLEWLDQPIGEAHVYRALIEEGR